MPTIPPPAPPPPPAPISWVMGAAAYPIPSILNEAAVAKTQASLSLIGPQGCSSSSPSKCTGFAVRGSDGSLNSATFMTLPPIGFNYSMAAEYPVLGVNLRNEALTMTANNAFPIIGMNATLNIVGYSLLPNAPVRVPFAFMVAWTTGYPAIPGNAGVFRITMPSAVKFSIASRTYSFKLTGIVPSGGVIPAPNIAGNVNPATPPLPSNFYNVTNITKSAAAVAVASMIPVANPVAGSSSSTPVASVYVPLLGGFKTLQINGKIVLI
eukprot:jgi/Chrzof1/11659/Cz06g04040.t1